MKCFKKLKYMKYDIYDILYNFVVLGIGLIMSYTGKNRTSIIKT